LLIYVAENLIREGKLEEAKQALESSLAENPDDLTLLGLLGPLALPFFHFILWDFISL